MDEIICDINQSSDCHNLSDVLKYYQSKKQYVLESIIKSVDAPDNLIDSDGECLFNLGSDSSLSKDRSGLDHKFRCKNCEMLSRICNSSLKFPIGVPFKNNYMNDQLIIKEYLNKGSVRYIEKPCSAKYHSSFNDEGIQCIAQGCLIFDEVRNGFIISWFVERLGVNVLKYTLFECGNKYYSLEEYLPSISLEKINPDKIPIVVLQIFKLLKVLEPFDFSINNPENLFVVGSDYTLKFDDFSKCGITLSNGLEQKRICSGANGTTQTQDLIIERSTYTDTQGKPRTLFRVLDFSNLMKCLDSSDLAYKSSINVYSLIIYLHKFTNFRNFFKTDPKWRDIYKGLFLPLEFKDNIKSLEDLNAFRLRADALDFIIDNQ